MQQSQSTKINSKQKGKRGERDWVKKMHEEGFTKAYRSQQYCGAKDSADVIDPTLPSLHFEVKFTQKLSLYEAMEQAIRDANHKVPVVAHRKNNHDWLVVMRAEDWFWMLRDTSLVTNIICPDCHTFNVVKGGLTEKGYQRYQCNNDKCKRGIFTIR